MLESAETCKFKVNYAVHENDKLSKKFTNLYIFWVTQSNNPVRSNAVYKAMAVVLNPFVE